MTTGLIRDVSSRRPTDAPGFIASFDDAMHAHQVAKPARHAALVLHALPESDRNWLLEQLPQIHREQLNSLLAELAELRIPASTSVLGAGQQGTRSLRRPPGRADVAPAAQDRLDEAEPKEVARILEREPAAVTARLLRLRDWPWKAAVLKRLSPGRRRQIELQLESQVVQAGSAPGVCLLDSRLLCLLEQRLGDRSAATRPGARPSGPLAPRWSLSRSTLEPLAWLSHLGNSARAGIHALTARVSP